MRVRGRLRPRPVLGKRTVHVSSRRIGALGALFVAMLCWAASARAVPLPDGRAYEMVSPVEKSGNRAGALGKEAVGYAISSPSGDRLLYQVSSAIEGASRGMELYAVGNRGTDGWRSMSPLPLPKGSINYLNYSPFALQVSENVDRFAYNITGGGLVPGNPAKTKLNEPFDSAAAEYVVGPGGEINWVTEPKIAAPNPAVGTISQQYLFTPVGGSPDLSTYYFQYHGTLVPEDASRAPNVPSEFYEVETAPQGLYRWHEGQLVNIASLPDGSYDPMGAIAAGGVPSTQFNNNLTPGDFNNQISADGNQVLFVSPDPKAGESPPLAGWSTTQLYVRHGDAPSVLVSKSELTGLPAPSGALPEAGARSYSGGGSRAYAYGSKDGSHVYFVSFDPLTADAPAETTTEKSYLFDTATGDLEYLPGVMGMPIAATDDLSSFVYVRADAEFPTPATGEIGVWTEGTATKLADFDNSVSSRFAFNGRTTADGNSFFFETNQVMPGNFNSGTFEQIYRYDLPSGQLSCVSCPPWGVTPSSDAQMSHNQTYIPSVDPIGKFRDARGISADGSRVFFDTADPLVEQDSNGQRDVYMWEGGKQYLISSGLGSGESFYLDNSESGNDVFFATKDGLDPRDTDSDYDVYDARVGGGFPVAQPPAPCAAGCQEPGAPPPFADAATASLAGKGNVKAGPHKKKPKHQKKAKHHKKAKHKKKSNHKKANHKKKGHR